MIILYINTCLSYGIPREYIEMMQGLSRVFAHSSPFYHSSRLAPRDQSDKFKKEQQQAVAESNNTDNTASQPTYTVTKYLYYITIFYEIMIQNEE